MVTKIYIGALLILAPLAGNCQLLEFHSVKKLPSAVNSAGEESLPLLAPGGQDLFFTRALYSGNSGGKFSGIDVWTSQASASDWKSPSNVLPAGINNEG